MRKPIEIEVQGLQTPRERIWKAILDCPQATAFTAFDVQARCRPMVKVDTVRTYLSALVLAGYLERVGPKPDTRITPRPALQYTVRQRVQEAPRLNRNGTPVTQGLSTLAMWRCMRVLKSFNGSQLAQAASVEDFTVNASTAKTYIGYLAQAGYLATVTPSRPGVQAVYRLVRNTGPHAPAITRRKVVFDRNTGTFAELQTAQDVADELE